MSLLKPSQNDPHADRVNWYSRNPLITPNIGLR